MCIEHIFTLFGEGPTAITHKKWKLKMIFMVKQLWCQAQCNEDIMRCRGTAWYINSLDTRRTCAWHHALSTHSTVFHGGAHNLHYETVTISVVQQN